MKRAARLAAAAALIAPSLAGCAAGIGLEPRMSPVGSGLAAPTDPAIAEYTPPVSASPQSLFVESGATIYRLKRASKVGDIVKVNIAINDQATLGNNTSRSGVGNLEYQGTWGITSPTMSNDQVTSTSTYQGQGNIARSEQIQVSIATVVTAVLPNGNLVLSGSQEVRVNYELRQLSVSGIVWPGDIDRNNSVPYDKIAEARISYGGRGRLDEVQQPAWGQQLWDRLKPF
jgi:flagellar L-ring protein FlgH